MAKSENLNFKAHAELKNVIGQDLINDDNIAAIELVKNALDANAKKVGLHFETLDESTEHRLPEKICIVDDGSGMSRDDIIKKWLNIAFSDKRKRKADGRWLAGNKGVGRFACDRLGQTLDLFTRKAGAKILHLAVDWTKFENRESDLASIGSVQLKLTELTEQEYRNKTGKEPFVCGTRLEIERLRTVWDDSKLLSLRRNLERFVDPKAAFTSDGAKIVLHAKSYLARDKNQPDHLKINGVVSNRVFENLKFKTTYVQAHFDPEKKQIETTLFHNGKRVYKVVETNSDYLAIPDTTIIVHYMNPYKKAYFKRQTGFNSVEFGAIFLFLNGYRISPYGDRDNDWLQLDNRKAQGVRRSLGNRELIGRIEVKDKSGTMRVVSNREGLVRNAAYTQLTDRDGAFYFVLKRLERFVVDGLDWDSVPEHVRKNLDAGVVPSSEEHEIYSDSADKKSRNVSLSLIRLIGASPATTVQLEIDADVISALGKEREEEVVAILEKFGAFATTLDRNTSTALNLVATEFALQREKLIEAQKKAAAKERQLLRVLSTARKAVANTKELKAKIQTQESEILFARLTAGSDKDTLLLFHHQNNIYANTVKNYLDKAITSARKGEVAKAIEAMERAMFSTARILAVTAFATKANFKLKTDSLKEDLPIFIKEYFENVSRDLAASNLKVDVVNNVVGKFEMKFKPIDLAIVFDNLASNSTRANAKNLRVILSRPSENELMISVRDDGAGLSEEIQPRDAVFNAGVTTTSGSGLGLYHVKQTVEQLGGQVSVDGSYNDGFGILIRLFK